MFLLRLNDMRLPQSEVLLDVAVGETAEALQRWLDSHQAPEPYTDVIESPDAGQVVADPFASSGVRYHPRSWHKVFTRGSPLEWYNPPTGPANVVRLRTRDEFIQHAHEVFDLQERALSSLPRV
jgi:hypothetical protein